MESEFLSYKKLIIFGNKGSGKSSLSKRIERGSFTEENPSENGNIIYNNIYRIYID